MITDPLVIAFCEIVQKRREFLGISQEEVAHRAGLHRTYISDIERGSRNLSLKNLGRLAAALEMRVSDLIHAAEVRAMASGILEGRSIQSETEDDWTRLQIEKLQSCSPGGRGKRMPSAHKNGALSVNE